LLSYDFRTVLNFADIKRDVITWSQFKPPSKTIRNQVILGQSARANNKILAGDDSVLGTTAAETNIEWKREAEG
jgi:hypothetical protein